MISNFVLLIGAMKAGTTSLFRLLSQHPAIAPCREKEPNYFTDPARRSGAEEPYENLWDFDPAVHRWAIEASTAYTKLPFQPSAAPFVARYPARFKAVYLVRNPIDRIRSHYLHSLRSDWGLKPVQEELSPGVVLFSNYHFQITPWEAFLGRDQLLVLSFEEFVLDPAAVASRVLEFLGLDPDFPFRPGPPFNQGRDHLVRYLAERAQAEDLFAQPLGSRGLGLSLEGFVRHASARLRPGVAAGRLRELLEEVERHITLLPDQVGEVRSLLEDDLARFRDRWGIDPWTGSRTGVALPA